MKKIYIIVLTLISLLIVSCSGKNNMDIKDLGIRNEKEIKLGKEIKSMTWVENDNEIVIDKNTNFYDLYEMIKSSKNGLNEYMQSINSTIKTKDGQKIYSNINMYSKQNNTNINNCSQFETMTYREIVAKLEGSIRKFKSEDYTYSKRIIDENVTVSYTVEQFCRYAYKNEKTMGGIVRKGNNFIRYYYRDNPSVPEPGTKLAEMESQSKLAQAILERKSLFTGYNDFNINGKTCSFNEHIKTKFNLYKNYIVLETENPFFGMETILRDAEKYAYYHIALANNCSTKITAYYNLETKQFEKYSIIGKMFDSFSKELDVNISCSYFPINEEDCNDKVKDLKYYIERKCETN